MLFNYKNKKAAAAIPWDKLMVYIIFVIAFAFFAVFFYKAFFTWSNLMNILLQTAMITIMAVAMTFVIGASQIDLSIGPITALSSLMAAIIINATNSILLGVLAGVGIGFFVGFINGLFVTFVNIPSFLVTLSMMGIVRGTAMSITKKSIHIANPDFNFWFGTGSFEIGSEVKIPILVLWSLLFVAIGIIILNKTSFGKKVLATGGNEVAAKFSGINTKMIKMVVMSMMGAVAGFAGILTAGRYTSGQYNFGEGTEISVIAAVILGGTSFSGGNGSILGSFIGSLMMGMIINGLIISGLDASTQLIVRGLIVLLAVSLSSKLHKAA